MFLKISPGLDIPLTSLDTKNHYPKFNGLGDMAIVTSETQIPFFFGTPCIYIYIYIYKNVIKGGANNPLQKNKI